MAIVIPRMHLFKWLVLMMSIISTTSNGHARARILNMQSFKRPKGTVKTIESPETGEVIDCVDIFKQPTLNHPLLKNHTIEVEPSPTREGGDRAAFEEGGLRKIWWKYGRCPEGSVPILRPQNRTNLHVTPLKPSVAGCETTNDGVLHEYAIVTMRGGKYTGARADINLWNPKVMDEEFSLAEIWLVAGDCDNLNTIEVGWTVNNQIGPKGVPALFTYWTTDNYKQTGCYNLACMGFVQTNRDFEVGALLQPFSTYDGNQKHVPIYIKRDDFTGRWQLAVLNIGIGYWPYEIFTSLKSPADRIDWGGEIVNRETDKKHTSTQMGSGHFPSEGFGKSAFFRQLKYLDEQRAEKDPENLKAVVTRSQCYDLKFMVEPLSVSGVNFYYGGPGFSPQCAD